MEAGLDSIFVRLRIPVYSPSRAQDTWVAEEHCLEVGLTFVAKHAIIPSRIKMDQRSDAGRDNNLLYSPCLSGEIENSVGPIYRTLNHETAR